MKEVFLNITRSQGALPVQEDLGSRTTDHISRASNHLKKQLTEERRLTSYFLLLLLPLSLHLHVETAIHPTSRSSTLPTLLPTVCTKSGCTHSPLLPPPLTHSPTHPTPYPPQASPTLLPPSQPSTHHNPQHPRPFPKIIRDIKHASLPLPLPLPLCALLLLRGLGVVAFGAKGTEG